MTDMNDVINFVGFWRSLPLQCPSPDATILNYLNDSEGGGAPLSFVGFWHPPPHTPQYLTILMTERGGRAPLSFVGLWHFPITPPPQMTQCLTILMTERGGAIMYNFNAPQCPPPYDSKILYYLNDRDEGLLFL